MAKSIVMRIFGSQNERILRKLKSTVDKINIASKQLNLSHLTDEELSEKTNEFKDRFLNKKESLDNLLPEAYAVCQEMSGRKLGMRHYDTQLLGGVVLHGNNIAEMKTGEGKTLVATLPAYLNSLSGEQVHVVTVNDYLAKRDANLMRPLYEALGLRVGFLYPDMSQDERLDTYGNNDIIYGTNHHFAFDYLRDNTALSKDDVAQKKLSYAIIDEVDSILIDEARTPLILSGSGEVDVDTIKFIYEIASNIKVQIFTEQKKEHEEESRFNVDALLFEKGKSIRLFESGYHKLESFLIDRGVISEPQDLYSKRFLYLIDMMSTTIRALHLYKNRIDYICDDNKIKIINLGTGRVEEGKRWSDGLHQAVEMKEGVKILPDNFPIASISLQNFFRTYDKISGMTGTADTEAREFMEVYNMQVVVIPTNKKLIRIDHSDWVFTTARGKYKAILHDIKKNHDLGRPVLVGTASVSESEYVSSLLEEQSLPHHVLNAKNHAQEAIIISHAGRSGAITIATNMAGRGTDIILGGNAKDLISNLNHYDDESAQAIRDMCKKDAEKVIAAGGLHVIGTTRHDSRRVDNQLMGRAGRQGDPGSSRFYASFEDDLLRIFAASGVMNFILGLHIDEYEAISHSAIDKAISKAQAKVESEHYNSRKEILKYDDINNIQRTEIYEMRREWLYNDADPESSVRLLHCGLDSIIQKYLPKGTFIESWDILGLEDYLNFNLGMNISMSEIIDESKHIDDLKIYDAIHSKLDFVIENLKEEASLDAVNYFSRVTMLNVIDEHWQHQLAHLGELREGIHLRGFAQKDPIQEYGKESLALFMSLISSLQESYLTGFIRSVKEHIAFVKRKIEHDDALLAQHTDESQISNLYQSSEQSVFVINHLYPSRFLLERIA